jgi:predicted amidophosphoribosyltransferase
MRKLKEPCRSCGRPLDPRWRVCPYCEAEVASSAREERSERRRRSRRNPDPQPRVSRASTKAALTEDTIAEPTASVRGERSVSPPPPDR